MVGWTERTVYRGGFGWNKIFLSSWRRLEDKGDGLGLLVSLLTANWENELEVEYGRDDEYPDVN